ncbi:MAG: hypothetical protein QY332_03870 [Anaerolineales bacterium]|nr:MAG: hypothetical protein QY332_03870 [Anaerolineales bacterium]
MKKTASIILAVLMMASVLGSAATKAKAAGLITYEGAVFTLSKGIVFLFNVDEFAKKNVKVRPATLYIGSDAYPLSCIFKADEGKIRCDVRGGLTQFAGQTGIIYLNGQIFYVIIPGRGGPSEQAGPLVCPDGEVPGADVEVDFGEFTDIVFVPGSTLEEVQNQAESWFSESDFEIVSGLYCGQAPT